MERALKVASYHTDHSQSCRMMWDGFEWRLFHTEDIIKSIHITFWYFMLWYWSNRDQCETLQKGKVIYFQATLLSLTQTNTLITTYSQVPRYICSCCLVFLQSHRRFNAQALESLCLLGFSWFDHHMLIWDASSASFRSWQWLWSFVSSSFPTSKYL